MAVGKRNKIDKVRASRDGHEYHEIWTARKALQLLWPDSDLKAIAVEGPSPIDQESAPKEVVEIADIVLYYNGTSFTNSSKSTVVQLKYSTTSSDTLFRASNAKKTVEKFANTYKHLKNQLGAKRVKTKINFQLITNRPFYQPLLKAIDSISKGKSTSGEIKKQADQFSKAANLSKKDLTVFASMCRIIGKTGQLELSKDELRNVLIDYSATSDAIASARLGRLRELVRNKAGGNGSKNNLILKTDILAVLGISDSKELLPCESILIKIGPVLEREQIKDALEILSSSEKPLLVHAAGGVGKTIFMQSLMNKLNKENEVIFFDSFGGGAYRSPEDARHLPKKGLIHIVNTLAFRGLCDPLLPESPDVEALLAGFRRRIKQYLNTISKLSSTRGLYLFIDAIDNSDIAAKERGEKAFPYLLLDSLDTKPIPGFKLIVSCRTERKPSTYAKCENLQLLPFDFNETKAFLQDRLENISSLEVNVAYARSQGNPRILDYLVQSSRDVLKQTEGNNKVEVDELLEKLINSVLESASLSGHQKSDINRFLAGLTVLPPPIPLEEYAYAHNIEVSAVESFITDLLPLLERNQQGIIFKDEPTETFMRNKYVSSQEVLHDVARNLLSRQEESYYATKALPGLLYFLKDSEQLFKLAFDERTPKKITSTVGKRNIRYARLKVATLHAAEKKDFNQLVHLMIELATVSEIEQRGINYIIDNPDLIIAFDDIDALRRLFECRTSWPGTRHARLSIAYTLYGDFPEAHRHIDSTSEWIEHYFRSDQDKNDFNRTGPRPIDIAAIPFFLVSQGEIKRAIRYLSRWRNWYSIKVFNKAIDLIKIGAKREIISNEQYLEFIHSLNQIGPLIAAMCIPIISKKEKKQLGFKLAKLIKEAGKVDHPERLDFRDTQSFNIAILKSSAIALLCGNKSQSLKIISIAKQVHPDIHAFRDVFYYNEVFQFVTHIAIYKAAKNQSIHEKDILPREIASRVSKLKKKLTGKEFKAALKTKISERLKNDNSNSLSYEAKYRAERFIDYKMDRLFSLTKLLSEVLIASPRQVNKKFKNLVDTWKVTRKNNEYYTSNKIDNPFLFLGFDIIKFTLEIRNDLRPTTIRNFLTSLEDVEIPATNLIEVVSILAKRESLQELAGKAAADATKMIHKENEVGLQANLFARLAHAIFPASIDEASTFFQIGLEKMDLIGSGDYEFINELLLFASSIKGNEIEECDFHTLSNICELNLGDEPHKFDWGAYGAGLSKVAGIRGLAKLCRWDDRSHISLSHTLLPYLISLLNDNKITPKDAISLNYLANPVEYYYSSTTEFAQAIHHKTSVDKNVAYELITQFQKNNPGSTRSSSIKALTHIANDLFGKNAKITKSLKAASKHYNITIDTLNKQNNPGISDKKFQKRKSIDKMKSLKRLDTVTFKTDVTNLESLTKAISVLTAEHNNAYELKDDFFKKLRKKVAYEDRKKYIVNICALNSFHFYWKLEELKQCKVNWINSSPSLENYFTSLATKLVTSHIKDIISDNRMSEWLLSDISDTTGVEKDELALELVKILGHSNNMAPGTVWLALASFICPKADTGEGQKALTQLLRSKSAKLTCNVQDGEWVNGLYPDNNFVEIASGLTWRMLGSPKAEDRWQAAHTVRSFANFERWEVVEALVNKFDRKDASAFQASELPFFYLHAQLWLLIALARIAINNPSKISNYKIFLISAIENTSHILMRYFASKALLTCHHKGHLELSTDVVSCLRNIDKSPYPRLNKKLKTHSLFDSQPDFSLESKFRLEYDFQRMDVDNLSDVFGKSCKEVSDMIAEIVHEHDPDVSGMYISGGRENDRRHRGLSNAYQPYGDQFGWHGLLIAAGKLLEQYPVTNDFWGDDPWEEWFHRYTLTRNDSLWLSDGTDRTPLEIIETLFERKKNKLAITGNKSKLLKLIKSNGSISKDIVIEGRWTSSDNIEVDISSALVSTKRSTYLAKSLLKEEPIRVYVPCFRGNEYDSECIDGSKEEFIPWIVHPDGEGRIDEYDPYGVTRAHYRLRIGKEFRDAYSLKPKDSFGRIWIDKKDSPVLWSKAWGRNNVERKNGPHPGTRLICKSSFLKKVLKKWDKDLLILIRLRHYKNGYRTSGEFTHTIAVAKVTKQLRLIFYKGRINHPYQSKY